MTLAFLAAFAFRPERPVNRASMRPVEWLALAAFYVAMVIMVGEVIGE